MERTKLKSKQVNKRFHEVFLADENEIAYDVKIDDNGTIAIEMSEIDKDGYRVDYTYLPDPEDMKERQQAIDYLMGKRNNFND